MITEHTYLHLKVQQKPYTHKHTEEDEMKKNTSLPMTTDYNNLT